ncbi:hypothetical protein [Streptomyces sp. TRM68367]|uniref:hypothetical protein n=1 Tax=Streptomyces sp. TRM68367 TaxID=2758415 RepID=UPI00165B7702|nr:hypothetical protein [Streptomyces sp. TRM68367]MBC9724773.1 hypothetical protein [Streptomyces sp. TRM68367]
MDLDAVADELYGLRPEDFTAARDARAAAARKEGDRALAEKIGKLRRPSLSAWAGNLLVREQPEQVEPLLRLGEGLRQAHRELNGDQLRELGRRQRTLINALTRQTRHLAAEAGHPIGESTLHEVEDTLHAVLADPEAAQEWAVGRLVKPLSPTAGFPTAEAEALARVPASPAKPPADRQKSQKSQPDAERHRRLTRARQEAEEAEQELHTLEEEATAAGRAAQDAAELVGRLQQRIDELTEALKGAEDEQQEARAAEKEAREQVRNTDRRVREARRRARTAVARAERLSAKEERAS